MRFCVKKLIFYLLLSVFVSFSFCTCFDPPEVTDESSYTNVEYSDDGKSVTIYLDGSAPVPANRAISQKLALLGHDFFEVTFLYNGNAAGGTNPANYKIAKASWELGEPAGVNDVYRTVNGVNYYYGTNPIGGADGIPSSGNGSAVLFVGKKSDKTLLAVGTLSEIDGVPITAVAATQLIKTSTTKVKFAVNAFKAGMSSSTFDPPNNSFHATPQHPLQTSTVLNIMVGGSPFPYFHLPVSASINATYTVGTHSASHNFSFYAPAIRYGMPDNEGIAASGKMILPKYTLPPNTVKSDCVYPYIGDDAIPVHITSPTAIGGSFSGVVGFSFATTSASGVICALTFRVPVYAVYLTPDSVQWFIKPGYGTYDKELDNGLEGNGGAVLIAIGDITGKQDMGLIMIGEQQKYKVGDKFNLTGFEIYFKDEWGKLFNLTPITPPPLSGETGVYPNPWGWSSGIKFFYDTNDPLDDITDTQMDATHVTLSVKGLVKVLVEYNYGSTKFSYIFWVEVNDVSDIDLPYENRYFIIKGEDWTDAWSRMRQGNYLLIFAGNVNLTGYACTLTGDIVVYMVSVVPGVTIGRNGGTDQTTFVTNGHTVDIYLGKWPFNKPAFAGGNVITNEFFRVETSSTFENYNGQTATNSMFARGGGSANGRVNVTPLAGMDISYHGSLGGD